MSLVSAQEIRLVRGGVPVLEVPRFELPEGRVLALVGPNGAGKSTFLQVLAGLLEAEGQLFHRGNAVATRAERAAYRRRVTLVFQDPLLFDTTVEGNIGAGLKLRGVPPAKRREVVHRWAERLGLRPLLGRSARKLSGGEAQRTALARALALEPEVLFLDEPFSALDAPTREALMTDLGGILRETRTTAVLVTHHMVEALRLADDLGVMSRGRLLQQGSLREVLHHPLDAEVAAFVGMESLVEGEVIASGQGLFRLAQGVVCAGDVPVGARALVGIRPEHVILERAPAPPTSARNHFPARVMTILPAGPMLKVELEAPFPLVAFVSQAALDELEIRVGEALMASFKASSVHVIRVS